MLKPILAVDVEWRGVIGYEDLYEVSSEGFVRSLDRISFYTKYGKLCQTKHKGKVLKTRLSVRGYCITDLQRNGKSVTKSTHRLVALAFIPNLDNLPQVNHKDGNKQNNRVDNLEWCTALENTNHAVRNGLSPTSKRGEEHPFFKGVIEVLDGDVVVDELRGQTDIKSKGYDSANISRVLKGVSKHHKGFTYRYKENPHD